MVKITISTKKIPDKTIEIVDCKKPLGFIGDCTTPKISPNNSMKWWLENPT